MTTNEIYYINHLVEYLIYNAYYSVILTLVTIINDFYKVMWEIRGINGEFVHTTTYDTLS